MTALYHGCDNPKAMFVQLGRPNLDGENPFESESIQPLKNYVFFQISTFFRAAHLNFKSEHREVEWSIRLQKMNVKNKFHSGG